VDAYSAVQKAVAWSADRNTEVISLCEEIIEEYPSVLLAWGEYAKRLVAEGLNEEAVVLWEKAPAAARDSHEFVTAMAGILPLIPKEQKEQRNEIVEAYAKQDEVSAEMVMLLVVAAAEEEEYKLCALPHL